MRRPQFTLQVLLLAVTIAASFCAGYGLGFSNGQEARFDHLVRLITESIKPSSGWENNAMAAPEAAEQDALSVVNADSKLPDLGEPDEKMRMLDGIQVVGSALTDDHVKAICQLTDAFKPMKPDEFLVRGIEHTGKNTAVHVWQERAYQAYQQLELHDGQWRLVETGAGFINFSSSAGQEIAPSD
jgi:hypothetical protein